mmetsp:Transcript_33088/g.80399  ORF Transcript_33088/g.80399 Transcript_33088/m.80399 type:complete len:277 (-) Transcript_33088:287-1117(-)
MPRRLKLGFIGAGQMASAMAKGMVEAKLLSVEEILASDKSTDQQKRFADLVGCKVTDDNTEVASSCETVIIAVKPGIVPLVLGDIKGSIDAKKTLIVSIAAGVSISTLQTGLPSGTRIVRVMPNTPCLVGETAAAFALGKNCKEDDGKTVESMLCACGVAYKVKENLLDAVTGLSGSGPAYIYMMIEAMADGGVRMGLPRPVALNLAAQTVLGSAKMVLETKEHPGALKDKVASPGGTTIAGIHALEKGGFRGIVMNAVEAAASRSKELSKPDSKL